ncbi:cytochrome b561, DM13 and DOMON domain-containing protein At5g54830-like [Lolium rigidum]|uniref:cytochrome b561, DM13 and DOMON domain-containing protein At5g54830-like n=1 Tax=Lolium rigidum TaxID=89674 RepID=UPI001F5C246D|nr:cytochrome b561, DM13 and DOMON domain-containing protein At5g54830-like [Lolium rigidum]
MAPAAAPLLARLALAAAVLALSLSASAAAKCRHTNLTAGFSADLTMLQHQLRGTVRLDPSGACALQLTRFDLLAASPSARFWAAAGASLADLAAGRPFSPLPLNSTFRNATLSLPFSAPLPPLLALFDPDASSDLGHVFLPASNSSSNSTTNSTTATALAFPAPTMFDNCLQLTDAYRLRWTLNTTASSVEIGLEAAVGSEYYMAFGWADPKANSPAMVRSDVVVAGFTEEGMPFAEDYYITDYSECSMGKDDEPVSGVCPDSAYDDGKNDSRLVYGHRRDGVSFVRYQRKLDSEDAKYDVAVGAAEEMAVVWAIGKLRPPDTLRPHYLPQNHGGPRDETFGLTRVNLSEAVDSCLGPLDAENKQDQARIIADGKTPLVVTSAPALRYPNPPNPDKVIYINKKEAPLLTVERGVPVHFSVQAGHDVALYVTSDPIGGNATLRNKTEVIYAGGPGSHGVPATPMDLVWLPDRNTPDLVYYQSLYEAKMGWKVQVVDGGLSDMYNSSVLLDDQQVTLFWTLSADSISIAARGEKKSGYLAVGFGSGMVNTYAYVGWVGNDGVGRVKTYWIDGKSATGIHETPENLTYVRCKSEDGIITFEFTRPLKPLCTGRVECKNIIDPTTPLKVVWAMGASWSGDDLTDSNMHSVTSSRPIRVLLLRGSAEAEQDLRPVLAVHGFMMFVAWGILLPGGILSARYLKSLKGDGWYQIHVYLQYSGIAIMFLGVLFAAAELRGFYVSSVHVKFGVAALLLAGFQPLNAYFRPKRPANGEVPPRNRVLWEYLHVITGRSAIIVGVVALFTGMKHLGHRYDSENAEGLTWALMLWVLSVIVVALSLEYKEVKRRGSDRSVKGHWVLGNTEEDDTVDLLHPDSSARSSESRPSGVMEVQLEPLTR